MQRDALNVVRVEKKMCHKAEDNLTEYRVVVPDIERGEEVNSQASNLMCPWSFAYPVIDGNG